MKQPQFHCLMPAISRHASTLEDIRDMRVADSTKKGYKSGLNQIKKWISGHGSPAMLKSDGTINLQVFEYNDFLAFVQWVYQNTSNTPGTIASYRSALKDLYKRENIPVPVEYESEMKDIFQGSFTIIILN
ncbi:hypothetical protein DYB25_012131 [Aphanomyces astaci]|uniref:Core-binding (CB) domain-containing protein n=1 Tax=Aphanomyces astaci TaxID=112090 RepID=A0A397A739_APHAT|nr:hypothetical protein DYB25_012131 [Aphanomyces astaci]RHY44298.1 hypothetical protein DYB30_008715 [Aphanomyces astaci]RHY53542.1 hypothetical protein DYB38_006618 [Aphanomyces astaci]RHZ08447.1 hypothetical protein DYB31_008535 [Aphanomyces astaci]RHZ29793.1 hypothetical protein DYB26_006850 [Aphanomyces astaci]